MEAARAPRASRRKTWWRVGDLREAGFIEALAAAPNDARLELHDADGLFYITAGTSARALNGNGGFNFSHTCPPDCPDDGDT